MTLEGQYEHFRTAQRDFNEAHKLIDRYVKDLYVLPKKFVETTGTALDRYIREYTFPEGSSKNTTSFEAVLEFIDQLDDFTENTVDLLNQHKEHDTRSKAYLKKIEELNQRTNGKVISEFAIDFIELTPELTDLHKGLKQIKTQADAMVDKLERLELRWDKLQPKVRA